MIPLASNVNSRKFWALKFVIVIAFMSFLLGLTTIVVEPSLGENVVELLSGLETVLFVIGGSYLGTQGAVDFKKATATLSSLVTPVEEKKE